MSVVSGARDAMTTLKDALRSVRRAPGFSIITVAALAVGMGGPIAVVHVYRADPHAQWTMGTTVLVIMSIALAAVCANVTALHLARGTGRRREIEIRSALGADSGRILRQLLTENLLLASGSGIGGLWLGSIGARLLPGHINPHTDWKILLVASVLAAFTWLASGVLPALRTARRRLGRPRRRRLLMGLNACGGCFFLIFGGIWTQSTLHRLRPRLTIPLERTYEVFPTSPDQLVSLVARLRLDPEIEAATISGIPLGRTVQLRWLDSGRSIYVNDVDSDYFSFMGASLLRGRIFEPGEEYKLVLGETAAGGLWPGQDPIGKEIALHWQSGASARYTVIGLVKDTGEATILPSDSIAGEVFTPLDQGKFGLAVVLVRGTRAILPASEATVVSLEEILAKAAAHQAMFSALLIFMGGTIAAVSAMGLAGVLWCFIVQRSRDLAIRVALGARQSDIWRVLMFEFLAPLSLGVGVGVLLAAQILLFTGHHLANISRFDPATYLVVIAFFAAIGVGAAIIAGGRALCVQPAAMLRKD